jgi:hypothetical protein
MTKLGGQSRGQLKGQADAWRSGCSDGLQDAVESRWREVYVRVLCIQGRLGKRRRKGGGLVCGFAALSLRASQRNSSRALAAASPAPLHGVPVVAQPAAP